MKTKIGIPFGLALVMFIGVFTTMLALGALNPRPAEAAIIASGLMVERSNNTVNAYADWTITATNDGTAIPLTGRSRSTSLTNNWEMPATLAMTQLKYA